MTVMLELANGNTEIFKTENYIIGSLYWSSKSTNPASLFGETWVQITDKFIYAAGSKSVNATGGSETVKLTESNLPAHSHHFTPDGTISGGSYSFTGTKGTVNVSGGNHRHESATEVLRNGKYYGMPPITSDSIDYSKVYTDYSGPLSMSGSFTPQGLVSVSSNPTFSGTRSTTENSGSGQSFSVMNPYIVKYCWERTA